MSGCLDVESWQARRRLDMEHRSPSETIKANCIHCNGRCAAEVSGCDADGKTPGFNACPFHRFRMGKGRPSVKFIRIFCLQCMGGNLSFVRDCEQTDCYCHPYRLGKNPARTGKGYFANQERIKQVEKTAVNGPFLVQNRRSAVESVVVHPLI